MVRLTYFVKTLYSKNVKSFKKLHANIFHETISKVQIYFSETFFSLLKLFCEIKQHSVATEKSYLAK